MKRYFLWMILLLPAAIGFAQDEKNLVYDANAQVRKLSGFSGVEVSGAIDLYISQGKEEAVAVSAGDVELIDRIRTEVKDNILHIYFEGKGLNWQSKWSNNKFKAYVTFKNLNKLEAGGACNVRFTSPVKLSDLKVELSGASDLLMEADIDELVVGLSGASECKMSGNANYAKINCSGASSFKAYDLKIGNCKVDASGASGIRITVTKELNARASGASSISYKGEGLIRDISSSGASSVKHRSAD